MITLRDIDETVSVSLTSPQWGYTVGMHSPVCKGRALDGSYPDNGFFDPPDSEGSLGSYDYRTCEINSWILTEAEKIALNVFLNNPAYGRGVSFVLDLGCVHSGFYPFGLDLGDTGKFLVRVLDRSDGGMLFIPYRRFVDALTLVLVEAYEGSVGDFIALGQTPRLWGGIAAASDGAAYAFVYGGGIYKRESTGGDFIDLGQTSRSWVGMTVALDGSVYACVYGGDIYKRESIGGDFIALGQTLRFWRGIAVAPDGSIFAHVDAGDIYKRGPMGGDFIALGQTFRAWYGITVAPDGSVFSCVIGGDIYKQEPAGGGFVALGQVSRAWAGVCAIPDGSVYACTFGGDIYKREPTGGDFIALGQTPRSYVGMTVAPDGSVYTSVYGGDIYKNTVVYNRIPSFTERFQGDFQIGACTGLMHPQSGITPTPNRMLNTGISLSGAPNSLNGPIAADSYLTDFTLQCNNSRGMSLIGQLMTTTRTADINIIAPAGSYLFGADKGSAGTYTCKFLGSTDDESETVLLMTHLGYEQWSVPLHFWRKF